MTDSAKLFATQGEDLVEKHPSLALQWKEEHPYILGKSLLVDVQGLLLYSYSIELHHTENFPYLFPVLFETGGELPRNMEWHVYPHTGNCCLKTLPEELISCCKGINLNTFYEQEVIPYFFNQLYRKKWGYYYSERSHGVLGDIEFYAELLKEQDIPKITQHLRFIAGSKTEPNRTNLCYCGSGKKYRYCHREAYRTLRSLNPGLLALLLTNLENGLKQAPS